MSNKIIMISSEKGLDLPQNENVNKHKMSKEHFDARTLFVINEPNISLQPKTFTINPTNLNVPKLCIFILNPYT